VIKRRESGWEEFRWILHSFWKTLSVMNDRVGIGHAQNFPTERKEDKVLAGSWFHQACKISSVVDQSG